MRYRLTVAYDGTDFHGWQRQDPPDQEPLRTVQGVLQGVVRQVMREPIVVTGASRTDSGVHARGQVAAFSADRRLAPARLQRAVNSRLPDDVQITGIRVVADDFEPIRDAICKGYRYRIAHRGRDDALPPLFDRHFVTYSPYELDADRMRAAAGHLVGEHDFASLTRVKHGRESTVREVLACDVTASGPNRLRIDVSGAGFLYNMVRIIAGTLLEVGRGRTEPDAIPGILAARDRAAAGPTLPPDGLCLMWIRYGRIASPKPAPRPANDTANDTANDAANDTASDPVNDATGEPV